MAPSMTTSTKKKLGTVVLLLLLPFIWYFSDPPGRSRLVQKAVDGVLQQQYVEFVTEETAAGALGRDRKHILQWTTFWGFYLPQGSQYFEQHCPKEKRCNIVADQRLLKGAHAALFFISQLRALPSLHPPHQHWLFCSHENPLGKSVFRYRPTSHYEGRFNRSVTYMSTSDFPHPYVTCRREPTPGDWSSLVSPRARTKKVLWFMSSVCSGTKRVDYYNQLKQHIDVDLVGKCGRPDPCYKKPDQANCTLKLISQYKFYLSFENGDCNEYITEKTTNPITWGLIPIVLGPPISNYTALFPPDSFLHVDNFTSPAHLARYLDYLDGNEEAYLRYHTWRKTHRCTGMSTWPHGPWLCDLCEFLWHPERSSEQKTVTLSEEFGPKLCRM